MIPASGTFSFRQIIAEFAGSENNFLSYYNGNSEVSNTYGNIINLPTSGAMAMRQFAGQIWLTSSSHTSNGTETVPSGTGNVTIEAWGQGGGGGGTDFIQTQGYAGNGGGAGAFCATNVTCAGAQTFSISFGTYGNGGAGTETQYGTGNTGSSTRISGSSITTITANGGNGGTATAVGTGGTGTGATIQNTSGESGVSSGDSSGDGTGGSLGHQSVFQNSTGGLGSYFSLSIGSGLGAGGIPSATPSYPNPNGSQFGGGGGGVYNDGNGGTFEYAGRGGIPGVIFTYFR